MVHVSGPAGIPSGCAGGASRLVFPCSSSSLLNSVERRCHSSNVKNSAMFAMEIAVLACSSRGVDVVSGNLNGVRRLTLSFMTSRRKARTGADARWKSPSTALRPWGLPRWVPDSEVHAPRPQSPLYPNEPTSSAWAGRSEKCPRTGRYAWTWGSSIHPEIECGALQLWFTGAVR